MGACESWRVKHRPGPKIASVAYPSSPGSIWMAVGNPTEPCFGWLLLRSRRQESAHSMHRDVGAPRVIGLFGDLFGGAYPHPDVAALPHATLSTLP